MPELPEVETVRCQLEAALSGAEFLAVESVEPTMLRDCSADEVVQGLPGRRIEAVERLGKFLIIRLSRGAYLTLHLGMTGQILVDPLGPSAHTRFAFHMRTKAGRERALAFRDVRKFGRLHLTQEGPAPRLSALGPDAWLGTWDADYLKGRLRGRSAPLKAFLLDQRQLAGIGNIYADEILWWTQLSPLRPGGSVTDEEAELLAGEIPKRLGEGVRFLGCSLSDFVDLQGNRGEFQNWLRAYGKHGLSCGRCGTTFVRAVVAGRGTSYCPGCQH
jgi:formamidopyrimidine-DNA glycosylase